MTADSLRGPEPVVLIVDDVPDNLALLSDALGDAGYRVLVALDGRSALASLRRAIPDMILLDAVMPGMDGFELCRQLKAQDHTREIPVIFMTGLTQKEDVVSGFVAGGADYVTKPIEPEELLARMAAHLGNARQLKRAREAVDLAGLAVVLLGQDGRAGWATPKAREWLLACFPELSPEPDSLPGVLREWVLGQVEPPSGSRQPLTMEGNGRVLRAHWQAGSGPGESLVFLEQVDGALGAPPGPRSDALTEREREVLTWLARGKTNRDIGAILGVSPRTVNKHLEHIYVKLGVETRTAAAAIALGLGPGEAGGE